MTDGQKLFISLLSAYFNNEKSTPCNLNGMAEMLSLAKEHNLTAVIVQALKQCGIFSNLGEKEKSALNQAVGYTVQASAKCDSLFDEVSGLLENAKITYTPVKGCVLKSLYPDSALRTSGDVDFVVDERSIERIKNMLCASGFEYDENAHTPTFNKYSTHAEFHTCFEGMNGKVLDFGVDSFESCTDYCRRLKAEEHILYMICHIAKHLANGGAGVRMLADIDSVVRRLNVNENRVLRLCAQNGAGAVCTAVFSLCSDWFNTPFKGHYALSENTPLYSDLSSVILTGGTFGFKNGVMGTRRLKNAIGKRGKASFGAKVKALLNFVFIKPRDVRQYYSYSRKHAFLIPAAYFNRLFNAFFSHFGKTKQTVSEIFNNGEEAELQARLLCELEIERKKQ